MTESTNAILQRAYELIEKDELEKAQELLIPLLETDTDNAALWWVYTHAVRDSAIGQEALDRALQLDPQYPGADELKADVLEALSPEVELLVENGGDGAGTAQSAADVSIDEWEDLQPSLDEAPSSERSGQAFVLLIVILLIVASGAGLVFSGVIDISQLLSRIVPSPEPSALVVSAPTEESPVAATGDASTAIPDEGNVDLQATSEPTATPEATHAVETEQPTEEPTPRATLDVESDPMAAFVSLVADGVSDFDIDPTLSTVRSTGLGDALVIHVCAVPGPEFNARLNAVMNAVVDVAESIPDDLEAVAVGLRNCDDPESSLRMVGVAKSTILEFADETITARDFQRAWQPLS